MGYTGWERTSDVFRKYIVGDLIINRDTEDFYTFNNYIPTASKSVKRFNKLVVDKPKTSIRGINCQTSTKKF